MSQEDLFELPITKLKPEAKAHKIRNAGKMKKTEVIAELWDHYEKQHIEDLTDLQEGNHPLTAQISNTEESDMELKSSPDISTNSPDMFNTLNQSRLSAQIPEITNYTALHETISETERKALGDTNINSKESTKSIDDGDLGKGENANVIFQNLSKTESLKDKSLMKLFQKTQEKSQDSGQTEGSQHNCEKCGFILSFGPQSTKRGKQDRIDNHMKHHTNLDWKHVCDTCDMRFQKEHLLISHLRIHGKEVMVKASDNHFICGCGKVLRKFNNMKTKKLDKEYLQHLLETCSAHPDVTVNLPFKCSQCDVRLRTQKALDIHVGRFHVEKSFNCPICDMKHSNKMLHFRHIEQCNKNMVDNEKHMCEVCQKEFPLKSELKRHLKMSRHLKRVGPNKTIHEPGPIVEEYKKKIKGKLVLVQKYELAPDTGLYKTIQIKVGYNSTLNSLNMEGLWCELF